MHTESEDAIIDEIVSSSEISIDPNQLDVICSDDHLLDIAKMLEYYTSYAKHLGIGDADLYSITTDRELTAPHEKPLKMLRMWQRKNFYTVKGHYRHLLRGIIRIHEDQKLVGDICKLLK